MKLSVRLVAVLVALSMLPVALFALLPGTSVTAPSAKAQLDVNVPVLASPNVDLVASRPGTSAISGVFSRSAPFFRAWTPYRCSTSPTHATRC